MVVRRKLVPIKDRKVDLQERHALALFSLSHPTAKLFLPPRPFSRHRDWDDGEKGIRGKRLTLNPISYRLTWNNNFSSHTGFLECRITRVLNTFLPNEITTQGSMSQPVLVTVERERQRTFSTLKSPLHRSPRSSSSRRRKIERNDKGWRIG